MDAVQALAELKRGCVECHTEQDLTAKLGSGRGLRVKLGVDPTSPDLHLGHTVVLSRLRAFQDLGHTAVLIIGDFTARIGDPSGRDATRPSLPVEAIRANAATYQEQAFKILTRSLTELRFNSEWLDPLLQGGGLLEILRRYTTGQLLQREDFAARARQSLPITLLELLYPLFQGYDSVAVKADVELGGSDQLFNLLVGRQMQKDEGQEPQVALTVPLLVGTDGAKKMSKSYGNAIALNDPPREMYGKVMSLSDELMLSYYELLTREGMAELRRRHPMEAKKALARLLVARSHGEGAAADAAEYFDKTFSRKELPQDIETRQVQWPAFSWSQTIVNLGGTGSRKEAQRLIAQGGFKVDGKPVTEDKITDEARDAALGRECMLQVGKHKFYKVRFQA